MFWKQVIHTGAKELGQDQKLTVRHAPALAFQFGERLAADIPAQELQLGGQDLLRPAFAVAQVSDLRPNQIQW